MARKTIRFGNICDDGSARTIISGCFKFGWKNLLNYSGASMTYVIEIYGKKKVNSLHDSRQFAEKRCKNTSESEI